MLFLDFSSTTTVRCCQTFGAEIAITSTLGSLIKSNQIKPNQTKSNQTKPNQNAIQSVLIKT